MKILILGGTIFLGRALIDCARARGHEVTLFHRGKHSPDLYPDLERILGDRNSDLDRLDGRVWDAVIDTCGYFPRQVRQAAQRLAGSTGHYTFISSISVYANFDQPGMDESGPVGTLEDETVEQITGETYGPLKALCEQAAEAAMPGRTLNLRPGLIVGPFDPSDRFTYWPVRVAKGGDVIAPERPDYAIQVIDVRDLAEWNIRLIEAGNVGVYNATGPASVLTLGELLETCRAAAGSDARFRWAPEALLRRAEIAPWTELPLWVPESEGAGFSAIDCSRAIATGLTFRPIADTVRDTLAWARTLSEDRAWRAGLPGEKEQTALALLDADVTGATEAPAE